MNYRYNTSGRVQPVEFKYIAGPGTCVLCARPGHDSDEIFATLGVELDFYGNVYLCLDCCAEIAQFVLFKAPEEYKSLEDKYKALFRDWNELRLRFHELKGILDARINSAGLALSDDDGDVNLPVLEGESDPDEVNRLIDEYQSVFVKPGKG